MRNVEVEAGPSAYMVTFRHEEKALNIDLMLAAPKANKIYTLNQNGVTILCYKVHRDENHEIYSFCVQGTRFKGPLKNELIVDVVSDRMDQSVTIEWPDEIPFAACVDPDELRNWPGLEHTAAQATLISIQFEVSEILRKMDSLLKDIQEMHARMGKLVRSSNQ